MSLSGRHYTRKVEVFPNFEGGELGRRDITHPRRQGQFTATNMLVNYRGHLVPRPGLKKIAVTGLSNGVVQGFGGTPVPAHDVWFIQGTTVSTFSVSGGAISSATTHLATTPTFPVDSTLAGTQVYFPNPGDKVYQLNPTTTPPGITPLTGSPNARCITFYGDRLVVGNTSPGTNNNTIKWNGLTAGVSDFNTWPAANFINIGDPWVVTSLDWQRQHLLIGKQNQWHVLTGQFGADGAFSNIFVRKVSSAEGPLYPQAMSLDLKDQGWFMGLSDKFPSRFDGTFSSFVRDVTFVSTTVAGADSIPPALGIAPVGVQSDGAVYMSNTGTATFINGVWTKHTFGVTVSGYIAPNGAGPNGGSPVAIICDGGGVSANPNFYTWEMTLDTPGIEGGTFSRAGDNSSTPISGAVTFPEWWSSDVAEVQVRSIIVDFSAYNTGSATNDHFDLTLNTLRRYESGDLLSSTVSYDAAAAGFSATGTRQRKIFGFNDAGLGNGFSMQFTNVKGIEIERIEVVLEDHPVRMGT